MTTWAVRMKYIPVGDASARIGKAQIHAYKYDGVAMADIHDADGSLTLDELRELRAMLDATIKRLETSC